MKFLLSHQLNKHKRTHLCCRTCRQEITRPQDLEEYLVNEEDNTTHYDCNKCNIQFRNFQKILKHLARDHADDVICGLCQELDSAKPTAIGYVCCMCDKVYDLASELKNHMDNHSSVNIQ
jgi:uncharacterized CHY-type Zn-finger protein